MRTLYLMGLLMLAFVETGCPHHQIAFQDIGYSIESQQQDASILVVIDQATIQQIVSIRSFMTGIANSWDARPGEMLKQVADIEFPQMFKSYEAADSYKEPRESKNRITLVLTVPNYSFDDFHATITVRAIASGPDRAALFDNFYIQQGESQGAKMFWAGAFGMKSAIRQSSFDAYKKIFVALRSDLAKVLQNVQRQPT